MDTPTTLEAEPELPLDRPRERPTLHDERPTRGRWGLGRWLLVLLAVAVLLWLGWHFFGPSTSQTRTASRGAPAAAEPVGVAKIATGDMNVVLTELGTVTPLATVTVQTQISGQLLSVGYQEGQMVKKGDLLAQIDPRPYQITLQQAQGALTHDTALLAQARSDLARYLVLSQKNSIAAQQVADQQFLVKQDEGLVVQDQASVRSAQLNLEYCRIVAPISGRVGLRLVDPGNYVQTSGATGLVVVTQLQPISVIFVVPEDNIPAVMQELNTGRPLSVDAYDRTDATLIDTGSLLTVDNTVDTTTGTVKLRAIFSNPANALFPNEFVNARLLVKTLSGVVEAPTAAIQQGAPGSFVYLLKPDGTVGVQTVKTGVTDGEKVEVTSGLKTGDTVVVDGADRLKDGAKVTITPDKADPAATPNTGPGAPPGQQTNAQPAPSTGANPPPGRK